MMYGFTGKILHINLTLHQVQVEEPSEAFYRQTMGGSAMGLAYLLRETTAGIEACDPQNILTLMLSAPTGMPISGQSRINANAKSPISQGIGDSQSGGFFPAELKFAGFDGIVLRGRSPKPVFLSILDGKIAFHDATHLRGKTTAEVEDILRSTTGESKLEILQHGPAAEHGVRYSSLVSMASRNNGRTGMGLVMASKNLRAIIVRGRQRPVAADPGTLSQLNKRGPQAMQENVDVFDLGVHGTAGVVAWQNATGTLPTRNYTEGQFEGSDQIDGEALSKTILLKRDTCFACIVRCKRVVEIKSGPYLVDPRYGGPEYETISTFGSYCGIADLEAISQANQICNMHGVDTIACGATIAFAMECFSKGIIGLQETGGLDLRFGNIQAMLHTLDQIVTASTPLGRLLGQGSEQAALVWGQEAQECLITIKSSEAPAHMPQAKKSLALIYAANPFGADHQSSEHDPMYEDEPSDLILNRLAALGLTDPQAPGSLSNEKIRFAVMTQIFYSLLDTLELCQFVWGPAWTLYGPHELVTMLRAVTGWDTNLAELMQVGERRLNLMRVYNAREGFSRLNDQLPKKFFRPLQGTGPTSGVSLDPAVFEAALDTYYSLLGWSREGIPTAEKLNELGLDWAVKYLPA